MAHKFAVCTKRTCETCHGHGIIGSANVLVLKSEVPCSACRGEGTTPCSGCRHEGSDCLYETLAICTVCGGSEGSLLPFCPERWLTHEEDKANYAHYCASTGPFAKATFEHVEAAHTAVCLELQPTSRGRERLSAALLELLNDTLGENAIDPYDERG